MKVNDLLGRLEAAVARQNRMTAADVSMRMSNAVESVMRYCWMEAGQAEPELDVIALRALIDDLWEAHERNARERGVELLNQVPEDVQVVSDPGLLVIVVDNLLSNAARHTIDGPVRAWVTSRGQALTLRVANRTDQLTTEDLEHLSRSGARTSPAPTASTAAWG